MTLLNNQVTMIKDKITFLYNTILSFYFLVHYQKAIRIENNEFQIRQSTNLFISIPMMKINFGPYLIGLPIIH